MVVYGRAGCIVKNHQRCLFSSWDISLKVTNARMLENGKVVDQCYSSFQMIISVLNQTVVGILESTLMPWTNRQTDWLTAYNHASAQIKGCQ